MSPALEYTQPSPQIETHRKAAKLEQERIISEVEAYRRLLGGGQIEQGGRTTVDDEGEVGNVIRRVFGLIEMSPADYRRPRGRTRDCASSGKQPINFSRRDNRLHWMRKCAYSTRS